MKAKNKSKKRFDGMGLGETLATAKLYPTKFGMLST